MFIKEWFSSSLNKPIGFEDVKMVILSFRSVDSKRNTLINTLSYSEQDCLIQGTLSFDKEETVINQWLENSHMNTNIILYGKNSADDSVQKKQKQLVSLGFTKVYVYSGGLFEWLLLQDIYGKDEFPTTTPCSDLLKYRPPTSL
jgi:Rhodanese-like domain